MRKNRKHKDIGLTRREALTGAAATASTVPDDLC